MSERKSWDNYFLDLTKQVASRATCKRKLCGCVIVKDNSVIATGYNGSVPRGAHCLDVGCWMIDGHCERCTHAEVNAICQAAKHGISIDGATAYITGYPCHECMRTMSCCGIKRIVVPEEPFSSHNPRPWETLRGYFIKLFEESGGVFEHVLE